MKKTNETDSLNELIILEEQKYHMQLAELKDQFDVAYESVKPINFIKSLFHEVTTTPEIKDDLGTNLIALGTGFISKKILVKKSHSTLKNILGTVLQFAIANVVAKHSDTIKSVGKSLLKQVLTKKRD